MNSFFEIANLLSTTTGRPTARMSCRTNSGHWNTRSDFSERTHRMPEFPGNMVIALDVHGTLISRNQADDLKVVQAFRQTISEPARVAGVSVIMASAAPSRELQRVASLLDLGDQPAVAELGHVLMPRALGTLPRLASSVTPDMLRVLSNLKRWLVKEGLPPGIFLEPKTVLVSLNWSEAEQERDGLMRAIEAYISRQRLPLYVSVSDATLDVGITGVNKAGGLAAVMTGIRVDAEMRILAIGDSRNDMDLLKVASPGLCGCPANSHPTVRGYVHAQGGVVSASSNLAGTLDALSQIAERISSPTSKPAYRSSAGPMPTSRPQHECPDQIRTRSIQELRQHSITTK